MQISNILFIFAFFCVTAHIINVAHLVLSMFQLTFMWTVYAPKSVGFMCFKVIKVNSIFFEKIRPILM